MFLPSVRKKSFLSSSRQKKHLKFGTEYPKFVKKKKITGTIYSNWEIERLFKRVPGSFSDLIRLEQFKFKYGKITGIQKPTGKDSTRTLIRKKNL